MKDHDLDVELDDITVRAEDVHKARVVICDHARDRDEAATFLDMLGMGREPVWYMGGGVA